MAKGIKKFDQEIRIVGSNILSMGGSNTGFTGTLSTNSGNTSGAYYVNVIDNTPWYANETSTYQLANNADVVQNTTDISTLSGSSFKISVDGVQTDTIGFNDTLRFTGGTGIDITWSDTLSSYTFDTDVTNTNYYLSSATFTTSNSTTAAIVTFTVTGASDVTLDLHKKLTLDNLTGVSTANAEEGDFLIYDASTGIWRATGITEDSLVAGSGISFDTGVSGIVTINNDLVGSGGTWKTSADGLNPYNVLYDDHIVFTGGTGISVLFDSGSTTFTIVNTYENDYSYAWIFNGTTINSGETVTVGAGTGLVTGGTSTDLTLGLSTANQTAINSSISAITFNSGTETLTYSTSASSTDVDMSDTWVQIVGDTMTGDLRIEADLRVTGDTIINGNLYVSGTATTINTENLTVEDNIIEINNGEAGPGVTNGTAGIIVDRGSASAYTFAFMETQQGGESDVFRIGETISDASSNSIDMSETQVVATRMDIADGNTSYNNSIAFWNSTERRFDLTPAGVSNGEIITFSGGSWVYSTVADLASDVNSWSTIGADSSTSATTSETNKKLTFNGGSLLTTIANGTNDSAYVTINHDTVSAPTSSTTSTNTTTFITAVSTDGYGHITSFTTESVDFSAYYTSSQTDDNFLSANTSLYVSGDTGTPYDALGNNGFKISGGTGIDTIMNGDTLVINSDNSELQHRVDVGSTITTLDDQNYTGALSIIIDYHTYDGVNHQEGQIRLLNNDDFVHDFQGDLDMSISDVSITSGDVIITHDTITNTTNDFKYYVKVIS